MEQATFFCKQYYITGGYIALHYRLLTLYFSLKNTNMHTYKQMLAIGIKQDMYISLILQLANHCNIHT